MTCEICHVAVHDLQKLMAENATQVSACSVHDMVECKPESSYVGVDLDHIINHIRFEWFKQWDLLKKTLGNVLQMFDLYTSFSFFLENSSRTIRTALNFISGIFYCLCIT